MTYHIIVTGGANRGGAAICEEIHQRGYNLIIHCRKTSEEAACLLSDKLNAIRINSAKIWCYDLLSPNMPDLPDRDKIFGIVANASEYKKSNLENFSERLDDDLNTHLVSHLRLISLCASALKKNKGAIVAIGDIRNNRPKKDYLTYQIAKASLEAAVRSLAIELAPEVRVNAVSPGPLEWPVHSSYSDERKKEIIAATPLGRVGTFKELAKIVSFLLFDATFTTGSTIPIDGGRSFYLA